jgi:pSer/pThr/pTyr-binding forkhead associated (FHA) protein
MPVITVNDQPYALHPGQNRLGEGVDADIHVGSYPALGIQAIIEVGDGHPVIRRATAAAAVRVNGVALIDPAPLMHGDKVEIGGRELLYSDDANSGDTVLVSTSEIRAIAAAVPSKVAVRPAASTGGRLVSLVDGKEYSVGADGVSIGRDASSAVVVAQEDVSRRHALVVPVEGGYEVRDVSVNGIRVNGVRVDRVRRLAQSDVIQVGTEEFRFHAEVVLTPPGQQSGSSALRSFLGAPASDGPPALATLTTSSSGTRIGRKYEIRVPLVSIGRAVHNDVSIEDSSISETHAKLHYRDRSWFITDLGSRNGTYVGGVRFTGERRLYGNVELRIGNVKMMFRPTGVVPATPKETHAVVPPDRSTLVMSKSTAAPVAATTPTTQPQEGPPVWMWSVVVIAMVAVAALFLLNR